MKTTITKKVDKTCATFTNRNKLVPLARLKHQKYQECSKQFLLKNFIDKRSFK